MATELSNTVLGCIPNFRHEDSQVLDPELHLQNLSLTELAGWGFKHSTDLSYRIELAHRIALTYDDVDQIILFDDITVIVPEWQGSGSIGIRGFDRALLPSLWLSIGFRRGGCVLVYPPPNSIEIESFLKVKKLVEDHLHRSITIRVFYEDASGHLLDLIEVFEKDQIKYENICEEFAQQMSSEFHPEYHIELLQRHIETITKDIQRSFVFPFEMTELHQKKLQAYSDRLKMSEIPSNDKAKHNFFLRTKGFDALPRLLAVSPNGTLVDNYDQYREALKNVDPKDLEKEPHNIQVFARSIIKAINQLHSKYHISAFVKLDASGTSGWSNLSPIEHPVIYNLEEACDRRITYLCDYIQHKVIGNRLPTMGVVEEFVEPEKRFGDIDADYTVCGFVLGGIFCPSSISLSETLNAQYIALWNSSSPVGLFDEPTDWQRMFETYSSMVSLEASEFNYKNGIYAGDLFLTKDGHHKQHDWNIRRGARSSPESLVLFGVSTYETKVTLFMSEFGLHGKMDNIQLFFVYKSICERLSREYGMYLFSTGFGYFGKNDQAGDFLKFNVLVNPESLENILEGGERQYLPRNEHRNKVIQIIRKLANQILHDKQ